MKEKFFKALLPTIVSILTYLIVNKLFPENSTPEDLNKDPSDPAISLRGSSKTKLINQILRKILKDKAIKVALISLFATVGIQAFRSEIITLLSSDAVAKMCRSKPTGTAGLVCDIAKDHNLQEHSDSIRKLILERDLNNEQKITLLKIKLDYIINGEYGGRKRFYIVTLLGIILTLTISGIGGLALFLEALYRLFKEGKISRAVYLELVKYATRGKAVPIEHLLDD